MPRTVRLRKCSEHEEDCQLQSTDDGPWEHTPQTRNIATRFGTLAGWEQEVKESVTRNLHKTENMRAWAAEAEARMRSVERFLDTLKPLPARFRSLETRLEDVIHDTREIATQFEERVQRMDDMSGRFAHGLEQLDEINQVYRLIEKSDKERLHYSLDLVRRLDTMEARMKDTIEALADETAKRMATNSKLKQQLDRVEDQGKPPPGRRS